MRSPWLGGMWSGRGRCAAGAATWFPMLWCHELRIHSCHTTPSIPIPPAFSQLCQPVTHSQSASQSVSQSVWIALQLLQCDSVGAMGRGACVRC